MLHKNLTLPVIPFINTLKQELNGTKAYKETSNNEKTVVYSYATDMPYKFAVNVKERQDKLHTMYWLPILHKRQYKAKCIANCSSCTTTELSIVLTFCPTAVKSRVIRYHATVNERSSKNMFWSIKNSGEVLSKLQARSFLATRLMIFLLFIPHYPII